MNTSNSSIREKEAPVGKDVEVDEYTARMDRMVNSLKKRSQTEQQNQTRTMIIWIGVGIAITIGAIYLMLNTEFSGQSLEFLSR